METKNKIQLIMLIVITGLSLVLISIISEEVEKTEINDTIEINKSNIFKFDGDCKTFNSLRLNETHCYRGYRQ